MRREVSFTRCSPRLRVIVESPRVIRSAPEAIAHRGLSDDPIFGTPIGWDEPKDQLAREPPSHSLSFVHLLRPETLRTAMQYTAAPSVSSETATTPAARMRPLDAPNL